ncbi:hypothetical protein B0T25DRAFT_256959 [Lasiosphaeria hispida]|uniref:D-xylose 1-dehydrogenase (NADP(+), D-xylono-1,5-lactone-forming) n=1 Tax=Lasiosphaeria hispida TaxID=260671 RepID=A0AAJ0HG84_9PEZI|nr:hypothetical protein B0T25DRAFT_256959 [Lasiosphaeria hispida]
MAGLLSFVHRSWQNAVGAPKAIKAGDAIKVGVLGAANIGPMALFTPARYHPEVIIYAVAARDRKKAEAYAKKHGIPHVFSSYEDLLASPLIEAVYIPLPNGLHLEWALKALQAGKHVLLEKPSVANAAEAALLFHHPLVTAPSAPVLLEAFHYRFHPAWLAFVALLDRPNVAHARASLKVPGKHMGFGAGDIRFNYALSGGALLDLTYTMSVLRGIYGAAPTACTSCEVDTMPSPPGDGLCDYKYDATWTFPNGGTGETHGNLQAGVLESLGDFANAEAVHRPVVVPDAALPGGLEKVRTRRVAYTNYIGPAMWHRIDVEDRFVVRKRGGGEVVREWTAKESKKAYTLRDAGIDRPSEPYWWTYKYMLDEFVNRVRGREGTGAWIEHEDSVEQAKTIDMAYAASRLPLRQTTKFDPASV